MKYTIRIKKNGTFRYIIKNGKFSSGKYLLLYITKNNKNENSLGICVSKKNGKSVDRNKMKRWLREVYKDYETFIDKNINIVVLYKKQIKIQDIDYTKVKQDFFECLKKQGVLDV
jgi:ribonuclease P protein component